MSAYIWKIDTKTLAMLDRWMIREQIFSTLSLFLCVFLSFFSHKHILSYMIKIILMQYMQLNKVNICDDGFFAGGI